MDGREIIRKLKADKLAFPPLSAPEAQSAAPQVPGDGPLCDAILHMLRNQKDRESLARYIESMNSSEHESAIALDTNPKRARCDPTSAHNKTPPFSSGVSRQTANLKSTADAKPWQSCRP
jgi:hypothetical protein